MNENSNSLKARLNERRQMVEAALRKSLVSLRGGPATVQKAIRYSLFAGGKRVRPILVLEACEAVGGKLERALPAACAMEMIHTYSLIHDDLPCMDNAEERRGRPTSHRVFGEANAVLCGDGLLTLAFELLGKEQTMLGVPAATALEVTAIIAGAAGVAGMVGGQVLDLEWMAQDVGAAQLRRIHRMKTGALIRASVDAGGALGLARPARREQLRAYGERIGLAFQIVDDLLDIEGDPALLGKSTQDADQGKITFPRVFGVPRSRQLARRAAAEAIEQLSSWGPRGEPLRALARFVVEREN